jgi:hypothetical protein
LCTVAPFGFVKCKVLKEKEVLNAEASLELVPNRKRKADGALCNVEEQRNKTRHEREVRHNITGGHVPRVEGKFLFFNAVSG